MNLLDRAIEIVAPVHALKRQNARMQMRLALRVFDSGYSEGAASFRKSSLEGWRAESDSPQKDIDLNLPVLRKRSRSLIMNAPIARSAVNVRRTNCVGQGLQMKSKIDYRYLGISKEKAKDLKDDIEREFRFWASSHLCDMSGQNNFYELQQIAFFAWMANGECFALPQYEETSFWFPYHLRIRLIEADRISTPGSYGESVDLDVKNRENGHRIYNGVEIDDKGRVAAYYICNSYPNDSIIKEWKRIEAYGERTGNPNILHIFSAEREEQYRGVPFLAPVVESVKQLTRYSEAEIMAAVINGLFTVMVQTDAGGSDIEFAGEDDGENGDTVGDEDDKIRLGTGIINFLRPGEKIEVVDAKRPNINFESFTSSMCKYIGAALEIPNEILLQNFGASYSASRAALLQAWKSFGMHRSWFISDFCQPVYELFLAEAVATGRLQCPGFFLDPMIRHAYSRASWSGPAAGQLDPVKEANGAVIRIQNGLSTREKEAIEINGTDFDDNVSQLELENEKMVQAFAIYEEKEETGDDKDTGER